ncbi:MAG: response regulator transcription factor [Limisphaerales bacterium]
MTKIMVVEDDVQASTFLAELLAMEGYTPIVVNESSKAVSMADATHPDAFLLDLMMPDPDGFKVCRTLRSNISFIETPIIIITAMDDTDSRIVAYGAGANDYVVKPFHIEELASKLKTLLGT